MAKANHFCSEGREPKYAQCKLNTYYFYKKLRSGHSTESLVVFFCDFEYSEFLNSFLLTFSLSIE